MIHKIYFPLLFSFIAYPLFAQSNISNESWKENYFNYFLVKDTSNFNFIQADSLLINLLSDTENETTEGMANSYDEASEYAETELKMMLIILFNNLEKEDSSKLYISQNNWRLFYKSESEYLENTFVAYSNFSKYELGREAYIYPHICRYDYIKERILKLREYVNTLSF